MNSDEIKDVRFLFKGTLPYRKTSNEIREINVWLYNTLFNNGVHSGFPPFLECQFMALVSEEEKLIYLCDRMTVKEIQSVEGAYERYMEDVLKVVNTKKELLEE